MMALPRGQQLTYLLVSGCSGVGCTLFSLIVLVDPLGLFNPDAVSKFAGSAKLELMLFLHFSWPHEAALVSVIRFKVAKDLKNSIAHTVACMINVLSANVLWSKFSSLELILSGLSKESTVFTIKLIRDNSNKNFVLKKNPILVFFKGNVKLKGAVMSTP